MGIYNIMFIGGLILALIFLVLTVVLFFALKIPQALGSVTGQTQRKAIEELKAGKTGEMPKRRRKSQARIIARDVKSSSTVSDKLTTFDTDAQKSYDEAVQKERESRKAKEAQEAAAARAVQEAELKAAEEKAQEEEAKKSSRIRINPKTGKRYELDNEETEILTYRDTKDDSESTTSVLGAVIPGEEEATDVLRAEDIDEKDLYDEDLYDDDDEATDILTSSMNTHEATAKEDDSARFEEESTDILTSNVSGEESEESEAETDVLTSDIADEYGIEGAFEKAEDFGKEKHSSKPSIGITDMLRKAMEEGKDIPDSDEDEDEDYEDEASYGDLSSAFAKSDITQDDVHGTLDENLTSVLKADMMPGAEKISSESDPRIDVIYSVTIVHTDETL